jgi:hypothetical protein
MEPVEERAFERKFKKIYQERRTNEKNQID